MKKVEFSGGNRILSAKALKWYDGMDQAVTVDANGIYYVGGERIGTLAELDAAFCQFQDEADEMDAEAEQKCVVVGGHEVNPETAIAEYGMDTLVAMMDDDLREAVHMDMAPCSDAEFLAEYLRRSTDDLCI